MPSQPSLAQSLASRRNGARSTGPVTEAGKARSAQNAARHEALWLHTLNPTDLAERDAALAAVRARWREIRADRLEAQALSTLLRYRARIQREHDRPLAALDALRQRPREQARSESEPPVRAAAPPAAPRFVAAPVAVPDEPEPPRALNRHQRRALAARQRERAA